ncbi:MAG: M14 family metallopeptidase [bacterium]
MSKVTSHFSGRSVLLLSIFFSTCFTSLPAQENIISPKEFFGFSPGADRKLARWDRIADYFYQLKKASEKIKVMNMGSSTKGNPFLVLVISSPENLSDLDQLQKINKKICDPRNIPEEKINRYINEGKAVICQSMGLHATEVGGTQMTPELTYDLLSRNDTETLRILNNVLFFMIPCFNPDGQIMVTDWYRETVGTEYEGLSLPWLYHTYAGHDNNRDGDYLNLQESKYAAKLMYVDWPPQAYIDHHQMGSYGARFYVPPYCEPLRPHADPLIWREISWYGSHIAYKLEEAGMKGVINNAMFPGWGHFGWHWITPFHNIAGMLTESASTKLATPLYIHPDQLKGGSRQFPEYEAQSTFPSPWPGGWWRLGDIVKQKIISARALLDLAARNKKTVLRNAYLKAKHQTERGAEGDINAVVIPADQHDYLTAIKMINTLMNSGIEVQKAQHSFSIKNRVYAENSYLLSLAQPKMGLIRNLLMETHYADNPWTRGRDDAPLHPYDLATHTMNEFMGVKAIPVNCKEEYDFSILEQQEKIKGRVYSKGEAYILDGKLNNSFKAVNALLDKDVEVQRLDKSFHQHRQGDFIIYSASENILSDVAQKTGVDFWALETIPETGIHTVKRGRLGMYRRYWGGNMDEGWTRLLLEQFNFPYESLRDAEIKKDNLHKKWDVIILPSDSPEMITGDFTERYRRWLSTDYPEKYKSGIGEQGTENLKEFVRDGGTLVTLGESYKFAVEKFDLKVENILEKYKTSEFFCPGSTIRVRFDNTHPLAYGMPEEGLVVFRSSPAFEIIPGRFNHKYETVVRYAEENLLKSGWLIGEDKLAEKAGMVCAQYGKGRIVIIGFRTQHRAQTDGTFKLLFNAVIQ